MGTTQAEGMAEAIGDGMIDLRAALGWHLASNHYPPVHEAFVPTCEEALEAAGRDDWQHEITMPNGLVRTAAQIIQGLHLEAFLAPEED